MKKLFLISSMYLVVTSAYAAGIAPSTTTTATGTTTLSNSAYSNASTTGVGSSYSASKGTASASTYSRQAITPTETGATILAPASSTSSITGSAFNVTTGLGTGGASTYGSTRAATTSYTAFNTPEQSVFVNGTSTTSGSSGISALANQGAALNVSATGSASTWGNTSISNVFQPTGAVDKVSRGSVGDSVASTSQVQVNGMVVDGVSLTPATSRASASTSVTVSGSSTFAQ